VSESRSADPCASLRPHVADLLAKRRSVAPRRLRAPAPCADEIERMLAAALAGPDHGGLRPWRFIEFATDNRHLLADLFEDEKRRRDPLAGALDVQRAREHALVPPALFGFVVRPMPRASVPLREQWLAAGGALANFLNAAHLLGYGAMMLSGERCDDAPLQRALGIGPDEQLAGFVSLGTIAAPPRASVRPDPRSMTSVWQPAVVASSHLSDGS
jgi:nitroreductase